MEEESDRRVPLKDESETKVLADTDRKSSDNSSSSSEPKKKAKKTKRKRDKEHSKKKGKAKKARSISSPSESSKSELDKLSADTASLRRQLETLVLRRRIKPHFLPCYSITNMIDTLGRSSTWSEVISRDALPAAQEAQPKASDAVKPQVAVSAKFSEDLSSSSSKKSVSPSSSSSSSKSRSSSSSSSSSSSASSVPVKKSKKHRRRRSKEKKDNKKKKRSTKKNKKRARKQSSDSSSSSSSSEKGVRERSRDNDKAQQQQAEKEQREQPVARKRPQELPFVVRQDFFKNIIKDAEITNKRIKRAEEEKATNLLRSRFGDGLVVGLPANSGCQLEQHPLEIWKRTATWNTKEAVSERLSSEHTITQEEEKERQEEKAQKETQS